MNSKPLIFILGLVLLFTVALTADVGKKTNPTPVPDGLPSVERPADPTRGPCYYLGYYANAAYYWSTPYLTLTEVSQRFTVCGPETLMAVDFMVYDDGSINFGDNDIYCTVYDDDGTGLPGAVIAQVTVPAGAYNAYPTWSTATFSGDPVIVACDFHVGLSTDGSPGMSWEAFLSDDGTYPLNRSNVYDTDEGGWVPTLVSQGIDANFLIEPLLCGPDDVGANHKMHYPQYPDEDGWDVLAKHPFILADDWLCTETGWVKDIHFWGSWFEGQAQRIDSFQIMIHEDIPDPDGPGPLYSMPGVILWEQMVKDFAVIPIASGIWQGWYEPPTELFWENDHDNYFQYNVCLDESRWFYQDEGTIYWLSISAFITDDEQPYGVWGWKSTEDHFNDDAVWSYNDPPYNWVELYEPSLSPGYPYIPGDVDHDGDVDADDAQYLSDWIYGIGPPPPYSIPGTMPPFYPAADADGDCQIGSIQDVMYLLNYVNSGGPPPLFCELYPPGEGPVSLDLSFVITAGPCDFECDCEPGNANGDGTINILDIVYLINYKYKSGPPPIPYDTCSGDANCDCRVDILDIVKLINFKYKEGPAPCTCEDWVSACGLPLRE